jgi:hypothetical protein
MLLRRSSALAAAALAAGGCLVAATSAGAGAAPPPAGHRVGLGKVVSSKDGGQIFGWDIDQHGTDGVFATSQDVGSDGTYRVSVETFDQLTGKIVKSFARSTNKRDSYTVQGIFTGDVGLVTHYIVPKGTIYAKRRYEEMNPVTDNRFTGPWVPPIKNVDLLQTGVNQDTTTSVAYGIELNDQDRPDVVVTDLAAGTGSAIRLDPDLFGLANGPQLAQDTLNHRAVLAFSPDGGAVGGLPPRYATVDLTTGETTQWSGLNPGPLGAGLVNGLAYDSATGIAATTTELNAEVVFYHLDKRKGTFVQLPGTGPTDQLNSGAAIASDPLHKLFLVADPVYAPTGDSAIVVYDEKGALVEAIPGFHFSNFSTVIPVRVAVNPELRMGWVDGPNLDQIQQFFY